MSHGYLLLIGGTALCAWAMWLFADRLSFSAAVVGYPLLALGLGLLISSSVAPSSPLSKVRGFALIAALAYSTYLMHKEVIHFVYHHLPRVVGARGWVALIVYFAVSFAAAFGLYIAVERPFLWMRERISRRVTTPAEKVMTAG